MYVKHLRGPARSKVQSFRQLEHAMPRCAYACGCAYSRTDGVARAHPVRVRVRVSVRRRERPSHGPVLPLRYTAHIVAGPVFDAFLAAPAGGF